MYIAPNIMWLRWCVVCGTDNSCICYSERCVLSGAWGEGIYEVCFKVTVLVLCIVWRMEDKIGVCCITFFMPFMMYVWEYIEWNGVGCICFMMHVRCMCSM